MKRHSTLEDIDFHWLSRQAPALAGDLAFKRFCMPKISIRRSPDHDALTARARFHLRHAKRGHLKTACGRVATFTLEPDANTKHKSVLIAHGWTSESSFMMVIAEQIRRAGFRAVLFDQPAHGYSSGSRTSLIEGARALYDVAVGLGPFHAVVAHSMGGLASLAAGEGHAPIPRPYPFERYILISCPNAFATVTSEFGDELGLAPAAQRSYERRLERIAHRSVESFNAAAMLKATGRPALVVHADNDEDVAFACAEEIVAQNPLARIKAFDGLGHRKILYATPVVRAIVDELCRA